MEFAIIVAAIFAILSLYLVVKLRSERAVANRRTQTQHDMSTELSNRVYAREALIKTLQNEVSALKGVRTDLSRYILGMTKSRIIRGQIRRMCHQYLEM